VDENGGNFLASYIFQAGCGIQKFDHSSTDFGVSTDIPGYPNPVYNSPA